MAMQFPEGVFKDYFDTQNIEDAFQRIEQYLNKLIKTIKPRKSVTIVLDGVAPNAKLKD